MFNLQTLKKLIKKAQILHSTADAENAPFLTEILIHYDLLDHQEKQQVLEMCLNFSKNIKGTGNKKDSLYVLNKIKNNVVNHPKFMMDLTAKIEGLPFKKGDDVLHRYVQAHLWDVVLHNYYFEKVDEKTKYSLRGWLLSDLYSELSSHSNMLDWLNKRLIISHRKNDVQSNIHALLNTDIEALDHAERSRYMQTLHFVFEEQVSELSLHDVNKIHHKISMYLDTLSDKDLLMYYGVPDAFLSEVSEDDPYMQKYACNRFFMLHWSRMPYSNALHISRKLLEYNRYQSLRTDEDILYCQNNLLMSFGNSININSFVSEYYFQDGKMGFKVMFALRILDVFHYQGLTPSNAFLLKGLYAMGDYLHIDVTPVVDALLDNVRDHDLLTIINTTFESFFTLLASHLNALKIIEDIPELKLYSFEFSLKNNQIQKSINFGTNFKRTISVFEMALKGMASDLGYSTEEIELLF